MSQVVLLADHQWAKKMVDRLKLSAYFGAQARMLWESGEKDLALRLENMSLQIAKGALER